MKDGHAVTPRTPQRIKNKMPCYGCTRRCVGCHATYEDYNTVKQEASEAFYSQLEAARKDRRIDEYVSAAKRRNVLYGLRTVVKKKGGA